MLWYASLNHWVKLILLIHSKVRQVTTPSGIWQRGRPSASILSLNSWSPLRSVGHSEDRTECSRLGNSRSNCVPNQLHIHLLWGQGGGGCGKEQRQGSDIKMLLLNPQECMCAPVLVFTWTLNTLRASLGTQMAKNLRAKQETWSIPRFGRSPAGGHGNPLQWILAWRIPMDRGSDHGVAKSWTCLRNEAENILRSWHSGKSLNLAMSERIQGWLSIRNVGSRLSSANNEGKWTWPAILSF